MLLVILGVLSVVDNAMRYQRDEEAYVKHCSNNGTLQWTHNGTDYTHENHGFCVNNGPYMAVLGIIFSLAATDLSVTIWGQFQISEY
jgi:hypothetical protein